MPLETEHLAKQRKTRKVTELRDLFSEVLAWERSGNPEYPYQTIFQGTICSIRVNDFPRESLYSLIADDQEFDFDEWPPHWERP